MPYRQSNYLGIFNNTKHGIKLINNKINCKIGFTEQRPRKRQCGGDYSKRNFDIRNIINVKNNKEKELYDIFKNVQGVEFIDNSKEEFMCDCDFFLKIQKLFCEICLNNLDI